MQMYSIEHEERCTAGDNNDGIYLAVTVTFITIFDDIIDISQVNSTAWLQS